MRAVSEVVLKKLLSIANKKDSNNWISSDPWTKGQLALLEGLLEISKELNCWLPIGESTPKDRNLLLLCPELGAMEGYWDGTVWYCDMWELTGSQLSRQPTHYQELPSDQEVVDG